MKEEKLRMIKEGYQQELAKLAGLKEEFKENEKAMTESYHSSAGDGAHDNGEFESLLNKERLLVSQINSLQQKIDSIEIIKVEELDEDMINIGDTVLIRMALSPTDISDWEITLIGADGEPTHNKISINSPLGKAIYKKRIGDRVSYQVEKKDIMVDIVDKVNREQLTGEKRL